MTAVWQERTWTGTFCRAGTASRSVVTSRVTLKFAAVMWSAHLPQQPQVGVRNTFAATSGAAAGFFCVWARAAAVPASASIRAGATSRRARIIGRS
jgi:hypothetical protein